MAYALRPKASTRSTSYLYHVQSIENQRCPLAVRRMTAKIITGSPKLLETPENYHGPHEDHHDGGGCAALAIKDYPADESPYNAEDYMWVVAMPQVLPTKPFLQISIGEAVRPMVPTWDYRLSLPNPQNV